MLNVQDEAISELINVVRVVNDSMHSVTIKGLPKAATPLGALVAHDIFQVLYAVALHGLTII